MTSSSRSSVHGGLTTINPQAPSRLEMELCRDAGVSLYESSLPDYMAGLDEFLTSRVSEPQT